MTTRLAIATLMLVFVSVVSALAVDAEPPPLTLREVEMSGYPDVTVRVVIPADLGLERDESPSFEVRENGTAVDLIDSERERLEESQEIVLVVDVSGSMRGQPIEDARRAAIQFVQQLGEDVDVAIIAVATDPIEVTEFVSDKRVLEERINALEAGGETALYDSLRAAVQLQSGESEKTRDRVIVVLSDGGDTTSVATLDQVSQIVSGAGTPVLAVAIESPEFNQTAMEAISRSSGGRLISVSDTTDLVSQFEALAREITTGYSLTFRSKRPSTKELEIDVVASSAAGEASALFAVANPLFVERVPLGQNTVEFIPANPVWMLAAVFLVFTSVGLLAFAGMLALRKPATGIDQVVFYDQVTWEGASAADADLASSVSGRLVATVDFVASRSGLGGAISPKLERAGIQLRSAEYITLHLLLVSTVGFTAQLLTGNLIVSALLVLIAALGPVLYLDRAGNKRVSSFESQLPDALNLLASGLRSGWGLQQAIDLVVAESGPPASAEFRRVQIEARLGVPVERALTGMSDRLGSRVLEWVVVAIAIQREVGGNLAEVLDNVARSIRERDALKRQVDALSAESRLSALILTILPFLIIGGLLGVSPSYLLDAMRSPIGWVMVGIGAILLVIGIIWLRALSRFEY